MALYREPFVLDALACESYLDYARIDSSMPHDAIALWTGDLNTLPIGWVLCDGKAYLLEKDSDFIERCDPQSLKARLANSVDALVYHAPDLSNRFVKGSNSIGPARMASGGHHNHSLSGWTRTELGGAHSHSYYNLNTFDRWGRAGGRSALEPTSSARYTEEDGAHTHEFRVEATSKSHENTKPDHYIAVFICKTPFLAQLDLDAKTRQSTNQPRPPVAEEAQYAIDIGAHVVQSCDIQLGNEAQAFALLPVGTVMPWPSDTQLPERWTHANGIVPQGAALAEIPDLTGNYVEATGNTGFDHQEAQPHHHRVWAGGQTEAAGAHRHNYWSNMRLDSYEKYFRRYNDITILKWGSGPQTETAGDHRHDLHFDTNTHYDTSQNNDLDRAEMIFIIRYK